jgi:hypothetical protein
MPLPFPTAVGLLALVCAAPVLQAQEPKASAPRPPARLYTNADLDRVHPHAAEIGGRSIPAHTPDSAPPAEARETRARAKGEAYWRAEAARVRERLRGFDERAARLRARIAERSKEVELFGKRRAASGASQNESLRAQLAALERRARATLDDLEERARREGALPGWLR